LQRWINRDPIEEEGGINLYSFTLENPINEVDYFGFAPGGPYHPPGGPYHPPDGVSTRCDPSDSCGRLTAKMAVLMKMLASHTGWDRNMSSPRGGRRHSKEIADLWRAYARCQLLHKAKKCMDPEKPRCWERVIERVPGSDKVWNNIAVGAAVTAVVAGSIGVVLTGGAAAPVLEPAVVVLF
jgi:hypothetical protein